MSTRAPKAAATPPVTLRSGVPSAQIPPWLRHAIRSALHLALDAAAIGTSYRIAYRLRFQWDAFVAVLPVQGLVPEWPIYQRMLYAIVPLWLLLFWYSSRLYDNPWMSAADRFLHIVKGSLYGTGASMVGAYIYSREEYSRLMLMMVFPIATGMVTLSQIVVLAIDGWMARREAAKPVVIVGTGPVADELKKRILSRHPEAEIDQMPELPESAALERALGRRPYCELILLRSSLPHARLLAAAELCDSRGVAFKMVPDLLELRLGEVQMDHSLGLPAYRIQHSSLTRMNFMVKRAFDLIFSTALLAATSVPLALACLLIKLDSRGPVLFKQKRYGFKGKVFEAYKFRTMVLDAEAKVAELRAKAGGQDAFFKAKKDPRVTRVGAWLRKFSLDEFPQFLNVLRGEMSVVGPRPLALATGEIEALERDFGATAKKRMNILPGITGLWQVSGRSDVSSEQRFALDLFYIEHWSLGLDLEIILKTVPAMLFGKGAY